MYQLTKNKIFQAVNSNKTITVKPEELNFCMRIPLTEGEKLTVKDNIIVKFLATLHSLPSCCKISLVNQKRDTQEFQLDELRPCYKEICQATDEEKKKLHLCKDWKSATAYYHLGRTEPFITFRYEIVKNP